MTDLSPQLPDEAVSQRRRTMKNGRRDETGFSTDALPHLTSQQVKWITYRASTESNAEACRLSAVSPASLLAWLEQPDFLALYQETMENKREGFKQLVTQSLPLVLQTLLQIMESGEKDADRIKAAALLMRNQGLLVDKVTTVDKDALSTLIQEVMKPRPILKTLPNPKDFVDGTAKEV